MSGGLSTWIKVKVCDKLRGLWEWEKQEKRVRGQKIPMIFTNTKNCQRMHAELKKPLKATSVGARSQVSEGNSFWWN